MASFERLKEDGRDPAYGTLSEMVGAAEAQQQEEKYAVNYAFWQRAARLLRIVWDESGRPDGARLGRWLLLQLGLYAGALCFIVLMVIPAASSVINSLVGSNQHDQSYKREKVFGSGGRFYLLVSGLALAVVPLFSAIYIGQYIVVRSRQMIQRHLTRAIFSNRVLYQLVVVDKRIDNYDQRITDDLQKFLEGFLGNFIGSFTSIMPVALVVLQVLFGLTGLAFLTGSVTGLAMLVGAGLLLLLMAGVLSVINRLSRAQFRQQLREGDLRFLHARAVTHAESIAFYGGEQMVSRPLAPAELGQEHNRCEQSFERVWQNYLELGWLKSLIFGLLQAPAGGSYLIGPCSVLLLYQYQVVEKSCGEAYKDMFKAYSYISLCLSAFYGLPLIYAKFSQIAGVTHRVGQLAEVVAQLQFEACRPMQLGDQPEPAECIRLEQLVAGPPGVRSLRLFDRLSLSVLPGQGLVIRGPSGCGKSSLLRVIAGLWPAESGKVLRPELIGRGGMFFVPQQPYITLGGLRAQLTYPGTIEYSEESSDEALEEILRLVELDYLLPRWGLHTAADWSNLLSGGEKQRLGLARLLHHCPKYAVMDEATSALDVPLEARLLKLFIDRGMTLVSVVHRASALPFHRHVLEFSKSTHSWEKSSVPLEKHKAALEFGAKCDEMFRNKPAEREADVMASKQDEGEAPRPDFIESVQFLRRMVEDASSEEGSPIWGKLLAQVVLRAVAASMMILIAIFIGKCYDQMVRGADCDSTALGYGFGALGCAMVWGGCDGVCSWLGFVKAIEVRKSLVKRMHQAYFRSKVIYAVNHISKLDTVDQRFVQDMAGMTDFIAMIVFGAEGIGLIGIVVYILVLTVAGLVFSWFITLGLYLYYALAYLTIRPFQDQVTQAQMTVQHNEGTLRFFHARVRLFTESIEFFHGEEEEANKAEQLLDSTIEAYLLWMKASLPLVGVVVAQVLLGSQIAIMLLCVTNFYIGGETAVEDSDGTITRTVYFFQLVTDFFGHFSVYFGMMAFLAGFVNRVAQLRQTADRFHDYAAQQDAQLLDSPELSLDGLTVQTPDHTKTLLTSLSLRVSAQCSLVITGPSGCGKSSLLRVIGGLWSARTGHLCRPKHIGKGGVFFLPQTNYTTMGSLREQVVYPHSDPAELGGDKDKLLMELLAMVQLEYLAARWGLDTTVMWDDQLSGGESQRLGFARLFYHNPAYAFMDEATSGD